MTTGKIIALTRWTFIGEVLSLLFNMLFRLVIIFLPRSKHLLISWLQSPSAVILEPQNIKSATVSPSISHEVMGPDAMIFVFWMLSFKLTFSLFSFTFIKRLFSSSSLSAIRVVSSAYLRLLIFLLQFLIPACASSDLHSFQRNPRADLLQNGLVGSPCSPRDAQESSPTPQFKSINSSALSFLRSPILTSIHDYWKNHSFD